MQIDCRFLETDDLGRTFLAANPQDVEHIYTHNFLFWTKRNRHELTDEDKKMILARQDKRTTPYYRGVEHKLHEIFAESSGQGGFSMLEIGASNGTVMHRLEKKFPKLDFRYLGFESLPFLAEDFREKYPGKTVHVGTAEDFVKKDKSFFGEIPFTLFYATGVFVMIKPDLVRETLRAAAALTDQFLILDFIEGPDVELAPSETLVACTPDKKEFWFFHPWDEYLAEIGFKVADKEVARATEEEARSPLFNPLVRGYGYLHALRE